MSNRPPAELFITANRVHVMLEGSGIEFCFIGGVAGQLEKLVRETSVTI